LWRRADYFPIQSINSEQGINAVSAVTKRAGIIIVWATSRRSNGSA
jgi:hypothetical protein